MIKSRRFHKIFFGWWTVLASGILALWGHAYYSYGMSALFKPIATDLNFTRATASIPTAIGRFEGGVEAPLSGWLTDRFGPREVVFFGIFVAGLSLILMNFMNSLWVFFVVWGVMLGTGINIALSVPLDTAITNWFVRKRGTALSIKWIGSGLSGVIGLPLVAWLIITQGWRTTCLIGGIVMWVIGLPLAWFCFRRHRPEYYGLLPDGATMDEQTQNTEQMIDRGVKYAAGVEEIEFTLRQAMKTSTYWLLITANAVHGLSSSAFNIHCIPFLTDIGIDPLVAAGMMVIYIAASIPFRFIGGLLADRCKRQHLRLLIGGFFFLQAVGFTIFLINPTVPMIPIWFAFYGIGMGASFTLLAAIVGRYFGRKAFGSIQGSRQLFMAPFSMAATIYTGWVYDATGSYTIAFTIFAILLAISAVLIAITKPPKPLAEVGDIRKIV